MEVCPFLKILGEAELNNKRNFNFVTGGQLWMLDVHNCSSLFYLDLLHMSLMNISPKSCDTLVHI